MTLPIVNRLRDTAMRIQREESIHLGNLRRLLVEAADTIEDLRRGGGAAVDPKPPRDPEPLNAVGVRLTEGRGKLSIGGDIRHIRQVNRHD